MATLAAEFAAELKRKLKADPEMAEELETVTDLRQWVAAQVSEQTEGDDMSPAVKRYIRKNLIVSEVLQNLRD